MSGKDVQAFDKGYCLGNIRPSLPFFPHASKPQRAIYIKMYLCLTVSFLYAFLLSECLGQVTIGLIPQGPSQCPSGSEGTATLSTVRTLPTGSQIIPAGDFWEQAGAVWTFETGNQGLLFSNLGFGVGPHGAGDIDSSAIKLDPSSTAWTLSVPSGASAVAIVWEADTTAVGSTASETTAAATTWSSGACKARLVNDFPLIPLIPETEKVSRLVFSQKRH